MRRFLKLKALLLLAAITLSVLMVLPSIYQILGRDKELPAWITDNFKSRFKLGLDLQGGLHLEYSVAVDEALENKLDQIASELESAFKEKKNVSVTAQRVGLDRVDITFQDPTQVATAEDDVLGIALSDMERVDTADEDSGVIHLKMLDERLAENRSSAVGQALDTVRRRIDAMGIAEPNIYPKNRQIVIELPGLSDTTTEIKAARKDIVAKLRPILLAAGAGQITVSESGKEPEAFKLTMPGTNARELVTTAFKDGLSGAKINDDRLGLELEIDAVDAGDAATPDVVAMRISEAARDKVLEESSDFRRLLKIIERAAVLEMRMVDDETPFGDTGKPYLRALYDAGYGSPSRVYEAGAARAIEGVLYFTGGSNTRTTYRGVFSP